MRILARAAAAVAKQTGAAFSRAWHGQRRRRLPPGGRRGGGARNEAIRKLEELADVFAASSARAEQDFLALGQALRELYATASQLAGLIANHADGLRRALAQSRIAGADGLAAGALRDLRGQLEETSGLLGNLREVLGLLRRLQTQVRSIERVGVFLKSSVFSFAIESARTAECQQAFGSFVQDLRGLTVRVARVGEDILSQIHATESSQLRGLGQMTRGLAELRRVAQSLETSAQAAADEAQGLLDASCSTLREAEERSAKVATHADEAVYHLQFGDIIRQKLEHVTLAVQAAARRLREGSNADFGAAAAQVDGLIGIQLGQLELMRREVLTAQAKLKQAFTSIADETDRLGQGMAQWRGARAGAPAAADPIAALLKDSTRMEELGGQGKALQTEARGTALEAVAASQQLASHLDQLKVINSDLHIEALNAIVKTAALGEKGVTLEVLSMQVDWLYRDSRQAVAEILSTLAELLDEARKTAPDEARVPVQADAAGRGDPARTRGLDRVGAAYRSFFQVAEQAAQQVAQQQSCLAATERGFGFLGGLAERFELQIHELEGLRRLLAPWKQPDQGIPSGVEASLDRMYTMQSERDIHLRANQGGTPVSGDRPGGLASAAAGPGALDNLEFFDAPAPEKDPAGAKAGEPSADKERATLVETGPAAKTAADENVEFF